MVSPSLFLILNATKLILAQEDRECFDKMSKEYPGSTCSNNYGVGRFCYVNSDDSENTLKKLSAFIWCRKTCDLCNRGLSEDILQRQAAEACEDFEEDCNAYVELNPAYCKEAGKQWCRKTCYNYGFRNGIPCS